MTDYRPIDCGHYSEFEVAILHGKRLRVSWWDPDQQLHIETLKPKDLQTRNHEEFLLAETVRGGQLELRLDAICKFETL